MYICFGLVLGFRHIIKPRNVKCNIFSELTHSASLLFFRKKINGNCNRKILRDNGKLKPNFVENLQWQFSDFSNLKTILNKKLCEKLKTEPNFAWQIKFAWHLKTENQTLWINVALIFSVRENIILHLTAVCINGWACGKSSLAQLFNLMVFLYL